MVFFFKEMTTTYIGIDLGTTYSCVAIMDQAHTRPDAIHNNYGFRANYKFVL